MSILRVGMDAEGNKIYTKLHPEIPKHNSSVFYYGDDSDFEARRKKDNEAVLSELEEYFSGMKLYARNGFKTLTRCEQEEVVISKKIEIRNFITRDERKSFCKDELRSLFAEIDKRIEKIYNPFIKWSRKNKK